jgi:hypothetical protein
MSLRTLLRLLALALATAPLSFLFWDVAGTLPILVGLGVVLLMLGYLVLLAGEPPLTRWHLRYRLEAGDDPSGLSPSGQSLEYLEKVLGFLAEKAGHFVVEANGQGLFLELPAAFDRYVEAQLPRALPEVKLSRDNAGGDEQPRGSPFLFVGSPGRDLVRWATEDRGRQLRLHIHRGPYTTLIARTDGTRPPGHWIRLPLPRVLARLWHRLPVWDELSAGMRLSSLLPTTEGDPVFSSGSRLLQLAPPRDYQADADAERRYLGQSIDGRPLTLSRSVPLFTSGAPYAFLVQQALEDLRTGRMVIVVSPHRRILEEVAQKTLEMPVFWLDPQNVHRSISLGVTSSEEWGATDLEAVVRATQAFLADLGLDVELPSVHAFTRRLIYVLASSARQMELDFSFHDLYALSRSTQVLRSFLTELEHLSGDAGRELLALLSDDGGYVQAVTILSAIHTALRPLGDAPFHDFCQPPFLHAGQALREPGLLLVPMTNDDFPEHDQLLSAMLDLTLRRVLATNDDFTLSLHLHDPHLYRSDHGQRWIEAAQQDPRLSLLLDIQQPERYRPREGSQVIFRCSETLAVRIIGEWDLPLSSADLTELPPDTAIARLEDMVVTLKASRP